MVEEEKKIEPEVKNEGRDKITKTTIADGWWLETNSVSTICFGVVNEDHPDLVFELTSQSNLRLFEQKFRSAERAYLLKALFLAHIIMGIQLPFKPEDEEDD